MTKPTSLLTKRSYSEDDGEMEKDAILHMRLEVDLKQAIDDLRRAEPDLPNRSEMVRRLISRAAEALRKAKRQ